MHSHTAYPAPPLATSERTLVHGPLIRLGARVRAAALDRALAAGANPTGSPQLAARASTLVARRNRAAVAEGLERLLAGGRGSGSRMRLRPHEDAVLANACELRELAALLRGAIPLHARGIALADELLSDGAGPVYHGDAETLGRSLADARTAMRSGVPAGD